jgi:hypothetical protein
MTKKKSIVPSKRYQKRIRKVAKAIKSHELAKKGVLGFNMGEVFRTVSKQDQKEFPSTYTGTYWDKTGNECGSVGCVIAHANAVAGYPRRRWKNDILAGKYLGLKTDEKDYEAPNYMKQLFYPDGRNGDNVRYENVTPEQTAAVMQYYARTGKFDWKRFGRDGKRV